MSDRRRLILGAAVVLAVAATWALALGPAAGRVDCRRALESAAGEYAHLAVIDGEGYVLPFSRLNLDDGAAWELEIADDGGAVRRVRDRSRIQRLQRQRFACTGTDMATPEMGLSVYRDGALVYRSDVVRGEGLQNPDLGFARAKNPLMFTWLLR